MHPLIEDVHRTDAIAVRPIATGATMVGTARHLGEVAALRTRLGRVRLTDFHELDAVPTKLVFQVLFQSPELQRPNLLVCPPGSAMSFFVVEGAEIPRVKDRNSVSEAKRDDLIGGMMQRIAGNPFGFLTGAVSRPVEAFPPPRPGLRAAPLLLELGQRFSAALLDRAEARPEIAKASSPSDTMPR